MSAGGRTLVARACHIAPPAVPWALRAVVLAALLGPGGAVQAGEWFLYRAFDEMRAYHGDYLSVCTDAGRGACRTVQAGLSARDFLFDQRLLLHKAGAGPDWVIEVMVRDMPGALRALSVDIDGTTVVIPPAAILPGAFDAANVAETVHIGDAALSADLLARMRAGNGMRIAWQGADGRAGSAAFSLRGVTAATDAIDAHVAQRGP